MILINYSSLKASNKINKKVSKKFKVDYLDIKYI